jgi:hypothetical protein
MKEGLALYAVPKERLREFLNCSEEEFEKRFDAFRIVPGVVLHMNVASVFTWPEMFAQFTDARTEGYNYRGVDGDGRAYYYKTEPVYNEEIEAWDVSQEMEECPEDWAIYVGTIDPVIAKRISKYSLQQR